MLALEQESEQHKPDQHDDALINPATSTVTSLERLERLERMRAADDTDTALEVKMPHAQDRARVKEAALAAASAGAQQLGVSQRYENAKQDTASVSVTFYGGGRSNKFVSWPIEALPVFAYGWFY